MLTITLPQEVINHIIDHLVDHNVNAIATNVSTLKACSTVSTTFRYQAQRNLFRNTHINISATALYSRYIKFQLFLSSRPRLCLCIEHLFLHIKSVKLHPRSPADLEARFSTLPLLPRLVGLHVRSEIKVGWNANWWSLPSPFQRDLETVVRLPTLRTLEIRDMLDVPITFLHPSSQLTKLVVHDCLFTSWNLSSDSSDTPDDVSQEDPKRPTSEMHYLKTFSLHTTYDIQPLLYTLQGGPSSSLSVSRLTELSMSIHHDSYAESCADIISDAYPFLESLHLVIENHRVFISEPGMYGPSGPSGSGLNVNLDEDSRLLTLAALRNLKRLHLVSTSWPALSEIFRLVASLPTEAGNEREEWDCPLEEVTLAVKSEHPRMFKYAENAWRPLDDLLVHARRLQCLKISIFPAASSNKDLAERFRRALPRWSEKGCLVVEVKKY